MMLRRVLRMLGGLNMVSVRQMCVMGCRFVVTRFVLRSGFMVVARSVLVVLRCLLMVLSCFL